MVELTLIVYPHGDTSKDGEYTNTTYIGVTPGSSHKLRKMAHDLEFVLELTVDCETHNVVWAETLKGIAEFVKLFNYRISWSPEINNYDPNRTDY